MANETVVGSSVDDEFAHVPRVPVRFDRILRALAVGFAGALAWGIRGVFGHELGAAIPGVLVAGTLALMSGHRIFRNRLWMVAALGGVAFSLGGAMSYGRIIGYTRHVNLASVTYGYACLLIVGGLWGLIGGAFTGLGLARRPTVRRLLLGALSMIASAVVSYAVLVRLLALHMTPPRSDMWAANLGAAVALVIWLRRWRVPAASAGAVFGALGFGLGFVAGDFFQTLGNLTGISYDWWKVMEETMGFFGGALLAWGVWLASDLGPQLERNPDLEDLSPAWWVRLLCWAVIFLWVPVGVVATRFSNAEMLDVASRVGASNAEGFATVRQIIAWAWIVLCALGGLRWALRFPSLESKAPGAFLLLFAIEMTVLSWLKSGIPVAGPIAWYVEIGFVVLLLVALALVLTRQTDARVFHLHPPKLATKRLLILLGTALLVVVVVSAISAWIHSVPLPGAHLRWK